MVQLSLWGLLSQEGEAPLRRPLLRELLRILPRQPELPLSLLLVIRRQAAGSRAYVPVARPIGSKWRTRKHRLLNAKLRRIGGDDSSQARDQRPRERTGLPASG